MMAAALLAVVSMAAVPFIQCANESDGVVVTNVAPQYSFYYATFEFSALSDAVPSPHWIQFTGMVENSSSDGPVQYTYQMDINVVFRETADGELKSLSRTITTNGSKIVVANGTHYGFYDGGIIHSTHYDVGVEIIQYNSSGIAYSKQYLGVKYDDYLNPGPKTFQVSFSSNGSIIQTQTVDKDSTATSWNPTLDGYTFLGWYSDNTLSTPFDFSTPITADITLFAKWEGNFAFTSEPTADGTVTLLTSVNNTVLFDASASAGSHIVWDFGDGTSGTGVYQTHYYAQAGTYTVKLSVYNDDGDVDVKEYVVSISEDGARGGGTMTSVTSQSSSYAYSEVVWSSGVFSDPHIGNTCPGAGQCAMSGHGKHITSPTEVFHEDFEERAGA